MNTYELTFLVEDAKSLSKLEEILSTFGGSKLAEQPWGKRMLAYPIEKKTTAEYYTWQIALDRSKLNEFKTKLNYDNVVMRYLFLAKDEIVEAPKKAVKAPKKTKEEVVEPEKETVEKE